MNFILDWQAIKDLTGYCRGDIKGFCEDEDFPIYPGRLYPFQALSLRNILLCNWSVREGYFNYYWQAQQAFELFWAELPGDVSDCQLAESWMAWCEALSYHCEVVRFCLEWKHPEPLQLGLS